MLVVAWVRHWRNADVLYLSGMDYASSNVAISKRRLGDRADIRQGSINEIPFESGWFDAALCLEVLEHIEDDARGVRDIARILKPGGFLIAAVPYTYYWPALQIPHGALSPLHARELFAPDG